MIQGFYHIREPSIDLIEKKDIADGKITAFSNNFMLKDHIIMRMKDIYIKSPKYCDHFVKVSHFVAELYESGETNDYLRNIVRN